jgi:Flp pilus assembly protein TadG
MLRQLRHERGQELVEYALVLPVLLVLILGILQFALIIMAYNTIGDASREAARLGVIADNADYPARMKAAAYLITDPAGMARADLIIETAKKTDSVTGGLMIEVKINYAMDLLVPLFTPSINLRAVSTKLIELG